MLVSAAAGDDRRPSEAAAKRVAPPSYIPLPAPVYGSISLNVTPSPGHDMTPDSPYLQYFTAPSSPFVELDDPPIPDGRSSSDNTEMQLSSSVPNPPSPPPTFPSLHVSIPTSPASAQESSQHSPPSDIHTTINQGTDIGLDDDGLSALEKIYLFSRSKAVFHRIFILHALPAFLDQIDPQEAVEYVLPLLSTLAMDEDDQVKEALATDLARTMWWFFTHCRLVSDDTSLLDSDSASCYLNVQAFTPILGTLLLCPVPSVGGAARSAIVTVLSRIRTLDNVESSSRPSGSEFRTDFPEGVPGHDLFGKEERALLSQELLEQVVIGMGRLDLDVDLSEGSETFIGSFSESLESQDTSGSESLRTVTKESLHSPFKEENEYFISLSSPMSATSNSSTPSSYTGSTASSSESLPSMNGAAIQHGIESTAGTNDSPPVTRKQAQNVSQTAETREPSSLEHSHSSALSPSSKVGDGFPTFAAPPLTSSPSHSPLEPSVSPIQSVSVTDRHEFASEDFETGRDGEYNQVSLGRLSSMSLMGAVTASGSLTMETKLAFVHEVERVSHDHVEWVRKEASFALGALAKEVPEEIVHMTLLPLFETLSKDQSQHVRHSALFALPNIMSRLNGSQKRRLTAQIVSPMAADESSMVRSGLLEALGEIIYAFHDSPDGPPPELINLFLGRRETRRVRDGHQQRDRAADSIRNSLHSIFGVSKTMKEIAETPLDSFYRHPARPVICAYNFPAVALTLGKERWPDIRDFYSELASNSDLSVQRTLAASVGEIAKIIGPRNARHDLVEIWWNAVRSEEEEVNSKAVDASIALIESLEVKDRVDIAKRLCSLWKDGSLKSWRVRESFSSSFTTLAGCIAHEAPDLMRSFVLMALEDNVAAVRVAAVSGLLAVSSSLPADEEKALVRDIVGLAVSSSYKKRMTFVACQEALSFSGNDRIPLDMDDAFWQQLEIILLDPVVGVRIALSRLVAAHFGYRQQQHLDIPRALQTLADKLIEDDCVEVRSFMQKPIVPPFRRTSASTTSYRFSRPPPTYLLSTH